MNGEQVTGKKIGVPHYSEYRYNSTSLLKGDRRSNQSTKTAISLILKEFRGFAARCLFNSSANEVSVRNIEPSKVTVNVGVSIVPIASS